MVLKLVVGFDKVGCLFYSSVILNGTETSNFAGVAILLFYSSVILNGTETVE